MIRAGPLLVLLLVACGVDARDPPGTPLDPAAWRPVWAATLACLALPADTLEPLAVHVAPAAVIFAHYPGLTDRVRGVYDRAWHVVVVTDPLIPWLLPHEFVHAALYVTTGVEDVGHASPGFAACGDRLVS